MNELYIKDGVVRIRARIVIIKDGIQIINPTEEQILAEGWEEYTPEPVETEPDTRPSLVQQTVTLGRMMTRTMSDMPAATALSMPDMFDTWEETVGTEAAAGRVLSYGGRLWKVLQTHTVQEQWKPGETGTESLYTEVVRDHAGTFKDPIPYNNNMELENGKYYSQDGVTYRCTRDTGIPVYNPLKDLVGIYVEAASE